jgi:hypothetical protein
MLALDDGELVGAAKLAADPSTRRARGSEPPSPVRVPGRRRRRYDRRMPKALVVIALAAALAGCGSGDDGTPLSREEFVAQADAICQEYEAKLNALGTPQSAEDLQEFADESVPIAEEGQGKLEDLTPPAELQDVYDEWLAQGDKAVDIVQRLEAAASENDQQEIQAIAAEAEAADARSRELAEQLGFDECSQTG